VDVAGLPVRRRVTAEQADAALAGTDLDFSQRIAAKGLLTADRLISCLVAPAGTGKTHVMAAFAEAWTSLAGGLHVGEDRRRQVGEAATGLQRGHERGASPSKPSIRVA
jgi:hypothetical protein